MSDSPKEMPSPTSEPVTDDAFSSVDNVNETITTSSSEAPSNTELDPPICDKSQSLVDIANSTFRELCKTLENEQAKLMELEERRKKLHDEMQRLKAEIEEEKHYYKLNIMESVAENLCNLNKTDDEAISGQQLSIMEEPTESVQDFLKRQRSELQRLNDSFNIQHLNTCYEEDESENGNVPGEVASLQDVPSDQDVDEHAKNIQDQLKSVLTECIIEQCVNMNESPTAEISTNQN